MLEQPAVSFVIPAYNEAQELPLTLSSLHNAAQSLESFKYEVIVCNNNSTDDTAAVAASLGSTVVLETERQISRARNTGARAANGNWLIFLDADTHINRRLLASVMQKIRTEEYGLVGSLVQFDIDDLKFFPTLVVNTWNVVSVITGWAAGSFIACPRNAFQQIGGFHQDYYAGEEINFSLRLHHWCRQNRLQAFVEISSCVITSGRKLRGRSTWDMVRQLSILRPGALTSKDACGFWYDDKWRE